MNLLLSFSAFFPLKVTLLTLAVILCNIHVGLGLYAFNSDGECFCGIILCRFVVYERDGIVLEV